MFRNKQCQSVIVQNMVIYEKIIVWKLVNQAAEAGCNIIMNKQKSHVEF